MLTGFSLRLSDVWDLRFLTSVSGDGGAVKTNKMTNQMRNISRINEKLTLHQNGSLRLGHFGGVHQVPEQSMIMSFLLKQDC